VQIQFAISPDLSALQRQFYERKVGPPPSWPRSLVNSSQL
jgi:hypothetical protein